MGKIFYGLSNILEEKRYYKMTKPIYQLYEEYRIIKQVCLICGHTTLDKNIENHIITKHEGEVDT